MYNKNDSSSLEKYSSAVTMSDMEIFIFPELLYALVLANVMSPQIWQWKQDPWFARNDTANPLKRVQRLKQYIMDHFSFNLDLDTWGLTTKQMELSRFRQYVDESILAESNALFGYEGDRYYFDIDIRKHFGLDKYTSEVIPYWKTETVEAMEAFNRKEGYPAGAGECVSLATLYAAASWIIAGVPLKDIYLYATPLHSQNFLDIKEGIITNNRRIVTKSMWYNGTELSAKARRAIENEKITLVAHHSGYIHTLYPDATINQTSYQRFNKTLSSYLTTPVTYEVLASFLRQNNKLQRCFQISHLCCGKPRFIEAEKVFTYEHSSKARVGDHTQADLLHDIEEDEFYTNPIPNRLMLSEIEAFFRGKALPVDEKATSERLKEFLQHNCACYNVDMVVTDLLKFCRTVPRLPPAEKNWVTSIAPIDFSGCSSPEEVTQYLETIRDTNPVADLAFTAFRDLSRSPWKPFLKAALERNPVSIRASEHLDAKTVYDHLSTFGSDSIYKSPTRLSQPDEVWNFRSGDGLEKAICFINILQSRDHNATVALVKKPDGSVAVETGNGAYTFITSKELTLPEKDDFSFAVP